MRYVQNESEILCLNHGWRFIEKDFSVLPPEASIKHDAIYRYAKAEKVEGKLAGFPAARLGAL